MCVCVFFHGLDQVLDSRSPAVTLREMSFGACVAPSLGKILRSPSFLTLLVSPTDGKVIVSLVMTHLSEAVRVDFVDWRVALNVIRRK